MDQTTSKSRLTVVSREAKKKQHASGLRDRYRELFTSAAALKFANAVPEWPKQLSLRNYVPRTFYLGRISNPKMG